MTVVMSFAGAAAAAAVAGGDGNAGEADQVVSASGVQAQPQAAIESGDQAHPQAATRFSDQVQPKSPQEFAGEQAARIVDEHKFFKQNHNFLGTDGADILFCSPWMLHPI